MDKLAEIFSSYQLSDADLTEGQATIEREMRRDINTQSENIMPLPPFPSADKNSTSLQDFNPSRLLEMMTKISKPAFPVPRTLPCANVQPSNYIVCQEPGKMACSQCKLVSYCSKACQTAHWRRHKRDCRNPMRLEGWQPGWVADSRMPTFVTDTTATESHLALGLTLWGNTPAMDVINLDCNENDSKKEFFLAFIASGDLRHVLKSINGLPSNYLGNLNIVLNDRNIPIVCRNIVLLLILGNVAEEAEAADIALHFWYSVFMPSEYSLRISSLLTSFLYEFMKSDGAPTRLGPHSSLYLYLPGSTNSKKLFMHFISSSFSLGDIQDEYNRVRDAPSRRDYRDRMYAGLKPSHRVAFQQYRRFGILLPFGAMNAHFNCPNNSLFTLEGRWCETDYADPLEGWDINSMIATGKRYGATAEDIYGCLYFFVSEQLRTFAHRLRTIRTTFTALCMDARHVPKLIQDGVLKGLNLPRSVRFDRIAVSNILDANYVGIEDVLTLWAPFLAETRSAAIVGYFMNWTKRQKDGRASGANPKVSANLSAQVMERSGMTPKNMKNIGSDLKSIMNIQVMMFLAMCDTDALYENSQPFSKFLQAEGMTRILRKTRLKMRQKHNIVPHRILGPPDGPANALPEFPDDDAWYHNTKLTCYTWTERFVEFERA